MAEPPEVRLAIVGTRVLACPGDRDRASPGRRQRSGASRPPSSYRGGADGTDTLAEQAAVELGYSEAAGTLRIFRPRVRRFRGPGGYRERDEQIAQACTHLLRIACRQATTYGSGWTADRAEGLGAVVVRYDVCGGPLRARPGSPPRALNR